VLVLDGVLDLAPSTLTCRRLVSGPRFEEMGVSSWHI
jgi:hypothetical protein